MSSGSHRWYALVAVTLAFTLNRLDAVLTGLFLQPMKVSLSLSDTQLGFITGIAFGVFYAILGVPLARWADYGNRVTIAALAMALWGFTLTAYLFLANFAQLVVVRIASAVGEAGCMPPTYSLIGDYFPGAGERARAMAIYWLSGPLAALIGFIAGGWLSMKVGWREAFCIAGVLGLVAGVLLKFTVIEPRRPTLQNAATQSNLNLIRVLATLWHSRSVRYLVFAFILLMTSWVGVGSWEASFLVRSHNIGVDEAGIWLGLIYGAGGLVGILLGGYVASRWLTHDEERQVRLSALMIVLQIPFYAAFLLLGSTSAAALALLPVEIMCFFYFGPIFALMQRLVVDQMRARTLAVVMLLGNLLGLGLGPQLVGLLSDHLHERFGNDSLRYAMLVVSLMAVGAAGFFWKVAHTVRHDLASVASKKGGSAVPPSLLSTA